MMGVWVNIGRLYKFAANYFLKSCGNYTNIFVSYFIDNPV